MAYLGSDYQYGIPGRIGVLLVNLGTPEAPSTAAVRRYLAEFLWDPRVVEIPRPLWWLILHGIVLPLRPRKSAAAYQKIWSQQGSPLLVHSKRISQTLSQQLQSDGHSRLMVNLAMRYGTPAIKKVLLDMQKQLLRHLLILPLFPQYSATTTASVFDKVASVLKTWRWQPEIRYVNHYYDDLSYIHACAKQIHAYRTAHGIGDKLLLSFHGLPQRNLLRGDPYYYQCHTSARLIAQTLSLRKEEYKICFQSRFGRAAWLQPYTDQTLRELAQQGVRTVDVFCPGFAADCLETLEEIALQANDIFKQAGGAQLRYIAALNDSTPHIKCLAKLIEKNTQGWEGS